MRSANLASAASQNPSTPVTIQAPAPDVGTLQSQLSDLRVQLTGVQARWDGLYSQLNVMLQNNPARPRVQQEWADAGVEMARIKGEIAYREAQLARAQGRPIGTTETAPPSRFPIRSVDVERMVLMSSVMLFAFVFPISIAWARRILRRTPQPAPIPSDLAPRLESIERAVDAIAIEVERISEGQRFVTKIFVDRPAQASASGSSAPAPSSAAPPPKALGAGPIQPLEVPLSERERVRQRMITPH